MNVRTQHLLPVIVLLTAMVFAACGGGDAEGQVDSAPTNDGGVVVVTTTGAPDTQPAPEQPTSDGVSTAVVPADSQPVATPTYSVPVQAQDREQVPLFPPNELGQIPILEYHHLGPEPKQFVRTPQQFRDDLQWLYDHGFYVVNLHDILTDNINVPAGKRPVALTFDDSPASQFSLIPISDGRLAIDPNSAIGIMELFFVQHPDFGRGGHFSVLPDFYFDWTPDEGLPDQTPHIQNKFRWLVENGYEIGNHTVDHVNLSKMTKNEIKYQLAEANNAIHAIVPDVPIEVITLPYGMYPAGGDDSLFRGFEYDGRDYEWSAALLVGANPTVSPLSTEYDPYAMSRIQAFDAELDKWFEVFVEQPGILYVSDGDPDTVTIPEDLHPWLVGTLNMKKIGDRELVRY